MFSYKQAAFSSTQVSILQSSVIAPRQGGTH
jgi:hypothetical protein